MLKKTPTHNATQNAAQVADSAKSTAIASRSRKKKVFKINV
jgi:hypothetical protein